MISPAIILAALLSLPHAEPDRADTPEQRATLYRPVAEAIANVARNEHEAAFLVAQAWSETRLARYVLEDRCHDGPAGARCDEGKARGPWQVHAWCKATTLEGEADCAIRMARGGRQRCRNGWLGAFAAQRGIASCAWSQAPKRVVVMRRALTAMRREAWEAKR